MSSSSHASRHQFARVSALIARFISYLLYGYLVLVEIFLFIGFFLLLFGADQSTGFVRFVYRSVEQAMEPFQGVFNQIPITNDVQVAAVFDPSVILAMIVYGVIAIGLHALIDWLSSKIRRIDVENRLAEQHQAYREAADNYATPLPDVMGNSQTMPAPQPGTQAQEAPQR